MLHPWLKHELEAILHALAPPQELLSPEENRLLVWKSWQEGLTVRITLPEELPPLRMLVILDNLTGHKTPELLLWMFARGVMVLYTPLGASWLNMRPSRCNGYSSGERWRGTIRRSPRRSSSGWRRRREDGTEIRRHLSGVAVGR